MQMEKNILQKDWLQVNYSLTVTVYVAQGNTKAIMH